MNMKDFVSGREGARILGLDSSIFKKVAVANNVRMCVLPGFGRRMYHKADLMGLVDRYTITADEDQRPTVFKRNHFADKRAAKAAKNGGGA